MRNVGCLLLIFYAISVHCDTKESDADAEEAGLSDSGLRRKKRDLASDLSEILFGDEDEQLLHGEERHYVLELDPNHTDHVNLRLELAVGAVELTALYCEHRLNLGRFHQGTTHIRVELTELQQHERLPCNRTRIDIEVMSHSEVKMNLFHEGDDVDSAEEAEKVKWTLLWTIILICSCLVCVVGGCFYRYRKLSWRKNLEMMRKFTTGSTLPPYQQFEMDNEGKKEQKKKEKEQVVSTITV
ncbi:unnamed protein product, partial [Mesorhabditis spiculigera]